MSGPLQGVRILDLTHVWAGPLAVRYLADLGADVVKIEAPYGRGPRGVVDEPIGGWLGGEPGDEPWNRNALFNKLNRNRRSLCVDLKQDAGRALLLALVGEAQVLVENFSAGAMEKLGLGWDVLRRANADLVYLTLSGFGRSGPHRDRVAFGPTVEVMSGLTSMLGYGPDEPRNSAMALMDPTSASHTVGALLDALRGAARGEGGALIEQSLHEGGVAYSGPWLLDQQMGHAPVCIGNAHPAMAPHGIYPCRGDDQWVCVACADQAQWRALAGLLELPADWPLAEREARAEAISAAIAQYTRRFDKQDAAERMQQAGVAAGPVNTTPDMLDDAQVSARGFFGFRERFDTPMPGNPIRMPGLDAQEWRRCPALGADNAAVLREWLGWSEAEIDALGAAGVLYEGPPG